MLSIDGASVDECVPVLDLAHLERQTLADAALRLEVLRLFQAQATRISADLTAGPEPAAAADLAHRLKGAALAIGAFRVAAAAEAFEGRVTDHASAPVANSAALDVLFLCLEAAQAAIRGVIHAA